MPESAYPKNYRFGLDNRSWLMRLKNKYFTVPLTASPRVPNGFWKWREIPITLFAVSHPGFRVENSDGSKIFPVSSVDQRFNLTILWWIKSKQYYISRVQCWSRYSLVIQWPLFFNFHVIYRAKDARVYPAYKSAFGITKMFTFSVGWARDADKLYRPTIRVGGNFE